MKRFQILLLVAGFLHSISAKAVPFITVDGRFGGGAAAITSVLTATIEVTNDDGDVLLATSEPSLSVADGLFTFQLDLADAATDLEAGAPLGVEVTIESSDKVLTGLVARGTIGRLYAAESAVQSAEATDSDLADALGGIPATELLNTSEIGSVAVAFGNITGLPNGIADGVDNGNVFAIGTGLALNGTTLQAAPNAVTSALLVDGSVRGAQIADGSIRGTDLQNLAVGNVANATLTGANFAVGAFGEADVVASLRDVRRVPFGCANGGSLSIAFSCQTLTCTVGGQAARRACDGVCEVGAPTTCLLESVGNVLLDP